ncbi:MAG: hypothetical protein ABR499_21485 [Gemmatimonadaceae bacterium]
MTGPRPSAAWRGLLLFAPVLVAAMPASGGGQPQGAADTSARRGAIFVQVTDTSINPLAAEVVVPALALGVRLTEEGTLLLVNVPDGVYLVEARHRGHGSDWRLVRVTRDTVRIDFVLAPAGRGGDGGGQQRGVAEARLLEFLNRTPVISVGSFITRTEIKRRRARTMTALLGRVQDVRIDRGSSGAAVIRSTEPSARDCASGMLVFVDAFQIVGPDATALATTDPGDQGSNGRPHRTSWRPAGGTDETGPRALRWIGAVGREHIAVSAGPKAEAWGGSTRRARAEIDRVPISSVAAVEIYPAFVGVPSAFRVPGAECGVVLIWTG